MSPAPRRAKWNSYRKSRFDRLVELNVEEQFFDLVKTSIIQKAWKERRGPHLHGWVSDLGEGDYQAYS